MADAVTIRTAELLCELTMLVGRLSDRITRLEGAAQAQPNRPDPAASGPTPARVTTCQP